MTDNECKDPRLERKILFWKLVIELYSASWITAIGIFLLAGGN